MINAKQLAVSGVLGLSMIAPFAMVQSASATTIKSQDPKLGCIDILVETYGSNGHPLPITNQFHFQVDGKNVANSDFRGTGRGFAPNQGKVSVFNLPQPHTYKISSTAPAGWTIRVSPTKTVHELTQSRYVRGKGLHGCSGVVFQFQQQPVPPIKGKKVVHKTVVTTTTATQTQQSNLPETGAGALGFASLGSLGYGVHYLRKRGLAALLNR